jgi:ATP-dependent RNA helicase DeaD
VPALEIAAALAKMTLGDKPLLLEPDRKAPERRDRDDGSARSRGSRRERGRERDQHDGRGARSRTAEHDRRPPPEGMERFRIEIGRVHGVQPGNIVGAIANEAGLDGQHIGRIAIEEDHSFVDLPVGMPREVFHDLKKVWVCGLQLRISRPGDGPPPSGSRPARPKHKKHRGRKPHRDA